MLTATLDALTIDIKRGIEKSRPYSILHIKDKEPFVCKLYSDRPEEPSYFVCRFKRMPETSLKDIRNDFFQISFKVKNGEFLCRIVPKKRALLYSLPQPLYKDGVLPSVKAKSADHWMVLGYEKSPPYLGKKRRFDDSILFPLDLRDYAVPTIGAVDINGEPVFMKNNRDVERFLAVKEAFKAKKYKKAYDLATEALEAHPDSIFSSDFLRYRIKALAADDLKEHAEEIIKLGKVFIKRYTSDEYLPEVLLILARVYSATGLESDADYFFDRLIREHKGSRFADLGLIYLGDRFYINGKSKEAIERYLEAYYGTKDLDIASLAAYKLAIRYLDRGNTEKGVEYIRKIWQKNPGFILKEREDAHEIAKQLAAHKEYRLAIEIDRALLNRLKKLDDLYETVLFEIAEWYDEDGDLKEAIEWYERYLDEFAYGEYSEKAKKSLDALFVADEDTNATRALERFETLMREYRGEPIAEKALAAKARVLLAQKRYKEVLELAPMIEKVKEEEVKSAAQKSLKEAANALFKESADRRECKSAVELVQNFKVEPNSEYDGFMFECYLKYALYDKALKIAESHLHDAEAQERAVWLCRTVHALSALERYGEAIEASEDLLALEGKKASSLCGTLDWDLVRALFGEKRYADAVSLVKEMSKRYANDMRMADIYKMGYDAAKTESDRLQQKWMLEKLVDLQRRKKSRPYSPWAEFELIKIYKNEGETGKALEVARSLDGVELKGEERARWLYELGSLYESSGDAKRARMIFGECAKLKGAGAWGRLCKEALPLQ